MDFLCIRFPLPNKGYLRECPRLWNCFFSWSLVPNGYLLTHHGTIPLTQHCPILVIAFTMSRKKSNWSSTTRTEFRWGEIDCNGVGVVWQIRDKLQITDWRTHTSTLNQEIDDYHTIPQTMTSKYIMTLLPSSLFRWLSDIFFFH